jgi:hypothetical protein
MGEWGWQMEGLTGNYLRVTAFAPSPRWNQIDRVNLNERLNDKIRGMIINQG